LDKQETEQQNSPRRKRRSEGLLALSAVGREQFYRQRDRFEQDLSVCLIVWAVNDLELKVIGRNLYMEGDYSWYELECVRNDGEKVWIDVDDDDDLVVSVVLKKLTMGDLSLSSSLENIDENESGSVGYCGKVYHYIDSGDAKFYKRCDDSKVEKLYYWDFKCGNFLVSVEEWKNEEGKSDYACYYSQVLKPSAITVYSTHGEEQK